MTLTGELIIGAKRIAAPATFRARDPATGEAIEPAFSIARDEDVEATCALAWEAFDDYRESAPASRAAFLEAISEEIMALGEALIERAGAETGLPHARLEGERGRTVGQLRLFAEVLRDGAFAGVRIDPGLPERKPLPRPDLRQRMIALGPVAVFGASNFPFAFSTAGGDTASALAAGCPVVVKGHPAHPGTGELVGRAVAKAARRLDLPEGVFSLLNGGAEVGAALVADPRIKAVGFTGSRRGGLALMDVAAKRPEPIPVFAEMSSVNPAALLPGALAARAEALGESFVSSLTMGAGQFCTNPGLLFALDGSDLDRFERAAVAALSRVEPAVMLTAEICAAYEEGVAALTGHPAVKTLHRGAARRGVNLCRPALFGVQAADFIADDSLREEVFGAASLIVRCEAEDQLIDALEALEGQLTATLHLGDADAALAARLLPILERKAGRILANGWPTGVEVCHAMIHGGPFPATSDPRVTSVGSRAMERFLRPVCYQNLPDALLPAATKADNPLSLPRLVDGAWER
ncbi:aldehyde dehydrogenase (NADP(+)) [Amphiplicatus metriothermophilus]|uniref:NADP-dependent aldehyde dehydrogenase n=1 Tax=Amphiplicatus metriothermophilus TaxID=1519374 RepID=A0A239PR83_9PROT|nr:aldehyde dehydrogenase (NADP(+)) [Amphiplicatus metriothermophilus]MBB5518406.1 NADP-dependent aldehyde dehydrogenase [Amphiplicatus metriothermophilus]SNT72432.1 NADP-dependent aldehyde dehydrogenase [Amphiplicatus metriothermophilus]